MKKVFSGFALCLADHQKNIFYIDICHYSDVKSAILRAANEVQSPLKAFYISSTQWEAAHCSGKYPRHNLSRLMSGICQEMTGSRWPGLLIQIQRTFPVDAFQCRGEISEGQRLDKLLTGREKMVVAKIVTKIQIYFEKLALWIIRTLLALWYIVIPWVILLLQTWPGRRSKPLIQRFSKDFRNSNLRNEDFSNVRKFSKLCFKGFCRIIEIPTFRAMFIQRFDWIYDFHRPKTWLLLLASIVASVFCYGSAYS